MGIGEKIVTNAQNEVIQHEVSDTPQDSIELSVNAKGQVALVVKAYGKDADDVRSRLSSLLAIAETERARIEKGAKPSGD